MIVISMSPTPMAISIGEGQHATGLEEMMLQAGMFDTRPRSRELIYVLRSERAARALGDLWMHANQYTLEQAGQFASATTPRGWLRSTVTRFAQSSTYILSNLRTAQAT
jgi:hypothetical protein